jgi:hypothetical protein
MSGSTVIVYILMVLSCSGSTGTDCKYVRYNNATYAQNVGECDEAKRAFELLYPNKKFMCGWIPDPNQY